MPYHDYQAVFAKNQAFFVEGNYEQYIQGRFANLKHTFLIRSPLKSIPSCCRACNKCGFSSLPSENGIRELYDLFKTVQQVDPTPVVIDADDLLMNPRELMEQYCNATGLPFEESMLSWTPGVVSDWTEFSKSGMKQPWWAPVSWSPHHPMQHCYHPLQISQKKLKMLYSKHFHYMKPCTLLGWNHRLRKFLWFFLHDNRNTDCPNAYIAHVSCFQSRLSTVGSETSWAALLVNLLATSSSLWGADIIYCIPFVTHFLILDTQH